ESLPLAAFHQVDVYTAK
nr:RecName: Full=Unknown protein 4 [Daucus carota]